jgi:hypothetical protein
MVPKSLILIWMRDCSMAVCHDKILNLIAAEPDISKADYD